MSEFRQQDEFLEQFGRSPTVAGGERGLRLPLLTLAEVVAVQVDRLDGHGPPAKYALVDCLGPSGGDELQVVDLVEGGAVDGPGGRHGPPESPGGGGKPADV